jgi:hypothetical protein
MIEDGLTLYEREYRVLKDKIAELEKKQNNIIPIIDQLDKGGLLEQMLGRIAELEKVSANNLEYCQNIDEQVNGDIIERIEKLERGSLEIWAHLGSNDGEIDVLKQELSELKEEIFTPTHTLTEWKIGIIDRIIDGEEVLREIINTFDDSLSFSDRCEMVRENIKLDGEKVHVHRWGHNVVYGNTCLDCGKKQELSELKEQMENNYEYFKTVNNNQFIDRDEISELKEQMNVQFTINEVNNDSITTNSLMIKELRGDINENTIGMSLEIEELKNDIRGIPAINNSIQAIWDEISELKEQIAEHKKTETNLIKNYRNIAGIYLKKNRNLEEVLRELIKIQVEGFDSVDIKRLLKKLDGEKSVASLDGNRESKKNPLSDSQPLSEKEQKQIKELKEQIERNINILTANSLIMGVNRGFLKNQREVLREFFDVMEEYACTEISDEIKELKKKLDGEKVQAKSVEETGITPIPDAGRDDTSKPSEQDSPERIKQIKAMDRMMMMDLGMKEEQDDCDYCAKQGIHDIFECPTKEKCIIDRDFVPKEGIETPYEYDEHLSWKGNLQKIFKDRILVPKDWAEHCKEVWQKTIDEIKKEEFAEDTFNLPDLEHEGWIFSEGFKQYIKKAYIKLFPDEPPIDKEDLEKWFKWMEEPYFDHQMVDERNKDKKKYLAEE